MSIMRTERSGVNDTSFNTKGGRGESPSDCRLCIPCHKQIHALYPNEELAIRLMTLERLKDDEELKNI